MFKLTCISSLKIKPINKRRKKKTAELLYTCKENLAIYHNAFNVIHINITRDITISYNNVTDVC